MTTVTHRPIRSFVLRQGRVSNAQQRAYDNLLPQFGVSFVSLEPQPTATMLKTPHTSLVITPFIMSALWEAACTSSIPSAQFVGNAHRCRHPTTLCSACYAECP